MSAITEIDNFIEQLQSIINESFVDETTTNIVITDLIDNKETEVVGLKYGDCGLQSFFLLANDRKLNSFNFVTIYPLLSGKKYPVHINHFLKWDNQIEATIEVFN